MLEEPDMVLGMKGSRPGSEGSRVGGLSGRSYDAADGTHVGASLKWPGRNLMQPCCSGTTNTLNSKLRMLRKPYSHESLNLEPKAVGQP